MIKPNSAQLTSSELKKALSSFKGKQQPRVITGIHDNPGILTHEVCGSFYSNNIPDIAQNSNPRLLCNGLKLICIPQDKPRTLTNSHHWYLCRIGELEYFDTDVKSANDEVLK